MIHTHTIDDDSDGPPPKLSEKDWWKQGCAICADHDREILQHGQAGPGLTPHTHTKGVSEFTILGPERRKPVVEYASLEIALVEHEKTLRDMIICEEECVRNWDMKRVFAHLCYPTCLYQPPKRARSDDDDTSVENSECTTSSQY